MPDSFVPRKTLKTLSNEDDFLRVELRTGLMFSKMALEARHQEKRDRNCANARRAYDALLHFSPKLPNGTFISSDKMIKGLAQLKSELLRLGEEL